MFGGPGAWDNAQKGKVQCDSGTCNGQEAAFFQVQIRSADEPMTTFYKVRLNLSLRVDGQERERETNMFFAVYDLRTQMERQQLDGGDPNSSQVWLDHRYTVLEALFGVRAYMGFLCYYLRGIICRK